MTSDDQKRAIGKVVSVSADKLVVELLGGADNFTVIGFDDVHYVARLGSFLMIPVQSEYVIAEVTGLREKDPYAGRFNNETNSDLDKAASSKYLDLVPVGMLPQRRDGRFTFGVSTFPSLYSDALYALDSELDRIFEVDTAEEVVPGQSEDVPQVSVKATRYKALTIGKSIVFKDYDVKVRVDDFFGGHIAVLGNTGSGKSCTVASILQSLFEKSSEYKARGATFIIFDVNGEYWKSLEKASSSDISINRLIVDGTAESGRFQLPHWFLELSEWELLLQASEKTQVPVLRSALGLTSLLSDNKSDDVRNHFISKCIVESFRGVDGDSPVTKIQRVQSLLDKYGTKKLNSTILTSFGCNPKFGNFDPPGKQKEFLDKVKEYIDEDIVLPPYQGAPFNFNELGECLDFAILYEEAHGNRQIRDYCSSMLTRFKSLCEKAEFEFLRCKKDEDLKVETFLKTILGLREGDSCSKENQIIILDMNTVDDEVVELISAVIARMIFRVLRQATSRNRFPVHLVLEEAHRYIAERPSRYAIEAARIFERIAKEGRKYGLFLKLASQRPSELSRTVLSQCANFIIHRIQNPEDLAHIRQMTPFISEAVLRRLPSLPKQHALVFGSAVNLPTTFRVRDANPTPASADANIRDLWFRKADSTIEINLSGKK